MPLLALLLSTGRVWAGPFDFAGTDWEGCSEFVHLAEAELGNTRVVTTTRIDYSQLTPDDGLVVLHPSQGLDGDEIGKFMRAGGRLVLLDDFGRGDTVLRQFGMDRIGTPKHPAEFLRNNPAFALAEPASAHPVVSDVRRVVTNHATGLTHPDLSPVLRIRAEGEPDVVVAVAGAVGKGRLLIASDPSIVMNSMLRYAGNKAFAQGIIRYAVEQDLWGKRGGRVYLVTGEFEQRGAFGSEGTAWEDALRSLRETFETIRRDGAPAAMTYGLAITVGLVLVLWVGSRAGRMHKPVVPSFVRKVPLVAQGGIAGHAAVIGAPRTSRALAVLELKSALEEQLASLLSLPRVPGHTELLARVEAERLLDAQGTRALRQVLLRMASVETMFTVQSKAQGATVLREPIREQDVVSIGKTVRELVAMAKSRAHAATRNDDVSSGVST